VVFVVDSATPEFESTAQSHGRGEYEWPEVIRVFDATIR
jgi:hypothetical protein